MKLRPHKSQLNAQGRRLLGWIAFGLVAILTATLWRLRW